MRHTLKRILGTPASLPVCLVSFPELQAYALQQQKSLRPQARHLGASGYAPAQITKDYMSEDLRHPFWIC